MPFSWSLEQGVGVILLVLHRCNNNSRIWSVYCVIVDLHFFFFCKQTDRQHIFSRVNSEWMGLCPSITATRKKLCREWKCIGMFYYYSMWLFLNFLNSCAAAMAVRSNSCWCLLLWRLVDDHWLTYWLTNGGIRFEHCLALMYRIWRHCCKQCRNKKVVWVDWILRELFVWPRI